MVHHRRFKKPQMSEDLPKELIFEILKCMPVKSLVRFKHVCKSWRSMIGDPHFLRAQLHFSRANYRAYVVKESQDNTCYICDSDFTNTQNLDSPAVPSELYFNVVSSCDGILLLSFCSPSRMGGNLCLWNPAIKKYLPVKNSGTFVKDMNIVVALCFNASNDDYEIVRIYYPNVSGVKIKVEVYSLSQQAWRIPSFDVVVHDFAYISQKYAYTNGFLHWMAWDLDNQPQFILSFDVGKALFMETRLPDCYYKDDDEQESLHAQLGEFNGFLSLIVTHDVFSESNGDYATGNCDIWVMKESSWARYFSTNQIKLVAPPIYNLRRFALDAQLLWVCAGGFLSCDLERRIFKHFICGPANILPYAESFLLYDEGIDVECFTPYKFI